MRRSRCGRSGDIEANAGDDEQKVLDVDGSDEHKGAATGVSKKA